MVVGNVDGGGTARLRGDVFHNGGRSLASHYDVLGLSARAGADEVREAYRRLAREYHPDVNGDPSAHEQMAQINVAFEVLSDPVRRMEYDVSIGYVQGVERERGQGEESRPAAVQVAIMRRLRDHGTPVYGLAFESGTGRLVSSSFDNEVLWWDARYEHPVARHKFEGGVVNAISSPGEGAVVAAGCTEQSLSCWVHGPRPSSWRQSPKAWVCCVQPSPDGKMVALGSVDRSFRVVRAADGLDKFSHRTHGESVTAVAWSRDSGLVASGSADATVKIYDSRAGREMTTLINVRSTVTSLAFSPNGNWLAVAAVDLSVRVFRLRDMTLQKTFFGHQRPIEAMSFHPRNWLLATASRDGSLGLWNVRQGIGHGQIEASHQPLSCVAFAPDGRHLVSGGIDKVLRVWRLSATAGQG